MKKLLSVSVLILLTACSGIDPYTPAGSCDEMTAEMTSHKARIARVGRLGQVRDVSVLGATVAIVAGAVTGGAALALSGGIAAASSADIDTTGNEKRLDLLWGSIDRRCHD